MPRGRKKEVVDPKSLSPEEYEKQFGRRKPGPKPGARRSKAVVAKPVARAARASAAPGLKKDGTPRRKPGPKPGSKRGPQPRAETIATAVVPKRRGPKPGSKRGAKEVPVQKARDLGPPPLARQKQFALIKSLVEDFEEPQLTDLLDTIETRLIGDTSDFTQEDWNAVGELQSAGHSKLSAVKNVRTDRLAEEAAEEAATMAQADEEEPADDDVEEEELEAEDHNAAAKKDETVPNAAPPVG